MRDTEHHMDGTIAQFQVPIPPTSQSTMSEADIMQEKWDLLLKKQKACNVW